MTILVRVFVLVSGLLLLLPPGWCCALRAAPGHAAAARPCCGCPRCHGNRTPARPTPVTPPVDHCPCWDRAATAPLVQELPAADSAPVLAPVACEMDLSNAEAGAPSADGFSIRLPSIVILHCSWRC